MFRAKTIKTVLQHYRALEINMHSNPPSSVQSRQRPGVCPCLLHSSLCAPQTDCWVRPCTAGGGHQAPQLLASRSSPPWLAGQLQRGDKVQEDNTCTVSVLYAIWPVWSYLRTVLSMKKRDWHTLGLPANRFQKATVQWLLLCVIEPHFCLCLQGR